MGVPGFRGNLHSVGDAVRLLPAMWPSRREVPTVRSDIIRGAKFADYELPDQDGKVCSLSTLQGNDPRVLLLARGGCCPKEHAQHEWVADMRVEIEVGYARVVQRGERGSVFPYRPDPMPAPPESKRAPASGWSRNAARNSESS